MAALTTQNIVAAGTAPTLGAAAATDFAEVGDGKNTFAVYKNTGIETTVAIEMDHLTLSTGDLYPNKEFTLAATTGELWIPLRKEYADTATAGAGRCTVTISTGSATGVTAAVVRVG